MEFVFATFATHLIKSAVKFLENLQIIARLIQKYFLAMPGGTRPYWFLIISLIHYTIRCFSRIVLTHHIVQKANTRQTYVTQASFFRCASATHFLVTFAAL